MRAIMFNCPQPSSQFKKAVKSTGSNPEKGAGGDEKGQKKKKKGGNPHINISSFLPIPLAFEHHSNPLEGEMQLLPCPSGELPVSHVKASRFPRAG